MLPLPYLSWRGRSVVWFFPSGPASLVSQVWLFDQILAWLAEKVFEGKASLLSMRRYIVLGEQYGFVRVHPFQFCTEGVNFADLAVPLEGYVVSSSLLHLRIFCLARPLAPVFGGLVFVAWYLRVGFSVSSLHALTASSPVFGVGGVGRFSWEFFPSVLCMLYGFFCLASVL